MRKVAVYKFKNTIEDGKSIADKEYIDDGILHGFGVGYEELHNGVGQYTTAIVEMPDGSVKNVYIELIGFLDRG